MTLRARNMAIVTLVLITPIAAQRQMVILISMYTCRAYLLLVYTSWVRIHFTPQTTTKIWTSKHSLLQNGFLLLLCFALLSFPDCVLLCSIPLWSLYLLRSLFCSLFATYFRLFFFLRLSALLSALQKEERVCEKDGERKKRDEEEWISYEEQWKVERTIKAHIEHRFW